MTLNDQRRCDLLEEPFLPVIVHFVKILTYAKIGHSYL